MGDKDLLALLAMIVPSVILIVLVALSLLAPANTVTGPPVAESGRNIASKDAHAQTGEKITRVAGDASARTRRGIATEDMIRDFWGRPYCASCVQVSETARCNSSIHDDERSCP